jgi:hypothetical protein
MLTVLPTEILVCICNILYEAHIPSLAAFSLGNTRCFAIAAPILVDTITFNVRKPAQLSLDVDACKQLLRRRGLDLFQHVRRLVIVGRMGSPWVDTGYGGTNPNWEHASDSESEDDDEPWRYMVKKPTWHFALPTTTDWEVTRARLHGFQFGSDYGRGAIPLPTKHAAGGPEGASDKLPASVAYDTDHHWRPLADIISQLPGLADVVFRCPSQFPPCLLKAIMTHSNERQMMRLHLQMFKLRSAYDDSAAIDHHEWQLITAPCLHSIWLQYGIQLAADLREQLLPFRGSPALDAVSWMVRQGPISPCLREVNMVGSPSTELGALRSLPAPGHMDTDFRRPIRPWNPIAFLNQERLRLEHRARGASPSGKGQLRHLRFNSSEHAASPPNKAIFERGHSWIDKFETLTDFSLLRTLVLAQPVSQEQLVSLKRACFPELATLSLTCELPSFTEEETIGSRFDYFQAIETFLSGLPSLRALEVTAWDHAQHVFSFENASLERLSLMPVENRPKVRFKPTICDIQQCPTLDGLTVLISSFLRLTDLSIPVRRSSGSSAEAAVYQYIGEHLPNLRRRSLSLDCSPPRFFRTNTNGHDTPLPRPYPSGPGWPAAAADLNRDRNEYVREDCCMKSYRSGHIYDVLINTALGESLALKIFAAVGGKVETLLVKTYGGLHFPQLGQPPHYGFPRGTKPLGAMLEPFVAAVGKQWLVEKTNGKVVVKELGLERFWSMPSDPFRIGSDGQKTVMQYFRRVWPEQKEGSKGWVEDWESWGLETE